MNNMKSILHHSETVRTSNYTSPTLDQTGFSSRFSDHRVILALATISMILGIAYAIAIRPGTAYDEPAHLNIVEHYANDGHMPIMGTPGVSYEAYQAPLFYVIAGRIYKIAAALGGPLAGYRAVQFFGLCLLPAAVALCYQTSRMVFPSPSFKPVAIALFIAINPSLLAIAASVQNDMLAILLSMLITLLAVKWFALEHLSKRHSFILGLLVSAAILSKLTALFLLPTIPLLMLWHHRRGGVVPAGIFVLTFAACSGWWFVRNHALYGDITGARALDYYDEFKRSIRPAKLWRIPVLVTWIRSLVTYLWLPFEYYRNIYHPPRWITAGVVGFTGAAIVGLMRKIVTPGNLFISRMGRSPAVSTLWVQSVACLAVYAYGWLTSNSFPARMILPTVLVFAIAIWMGLLDLSKSKVVRRTLFIVFAAYILSANVYVLWRFNTAPSFPFDIEFK